MKCWLLYIPCAFPSLSLLTPFPSLTSIPHQQGLLSGLPWDTSSDPYSSPALPPFSTPGSLPGPLLGTDPSYPALGCPSTSVILLPRQGHPADELGLGFLTFREGSFSEEGTRTCGSPHRPFTQTPPCKLSPSNIFLSIECRAETAH